MTQITGRPGVNIFEGPKNVQELSEGRGYRVGKDGTLKKTNKVGTFFKESFGTGTVRRQNQKTLDTLMRQLAQDYGSAAAARGRESLRIPGEVLSGKRVITGQTLKDIAASVRAVSASMVQSASGPLTFGLKGVLGKDNPTPAEVLQTIRMNMPRDTEPQVRQMVFQQAVSALDEARLEKLQSIMSGPGVARAKQLLDSAIEMATNDLKGNGPATPSKVVTAILPLRDAIALTGEALRICGHMNNHSVPEAPSTNGGGWKTPDPEALKILDAFGLGRINLAKLALSDTMPKETKASVLRGNSFGILLFRSIGSDALYGPLKGVVDDLKETVLGHLDDLMQLCDISTPIQISSKLSGLLKESTDPKHPDALPYLNLVAEAMQKRPELKQSLGECVVLMREHIEPLVREQFGDATPGIMRSVFNGLFSVGVTGTLNSEALSITDERTKAALLTTITIFQRGMASNFLASDQAFGKYMDTVPGWKELTGTK